VRPDYDGLVVSPSLPSAWAEARVTRRFRGCLYDIHITNTRRSRGGEASLSVNGASHEGPLPAGSPDERFSVECEII